MDYKQQILTQVFSSSPLNFLLQTYERELFQLKEADQDMVRYHEGRISGLESALSLLGVYYEDMNHIKNNVQDHQGV